MNTFILIIYVYAAALADGDSVALTNVPGFHTIEACNTAGKATKNFVRGTTKNLEFVCVKSS
jgi:hypothetical protein